MENETRYIYGLVDPETKEIRYIGKSIRPIERLQNHMNDKSKCHRANWLQGLKKKGLKPELVIFEMIQGSNDWSWQESEKYWIKRGRALGWPLTNNTDGGDGVVNLPPETREKMRLTWLGRKHKPETLIKLSKASKGRIKTQEMRDAMSEKMKGRIITWGDKVSEATKKFTQEQVNEIKIRLDSGELGVDLSKEYGVHRTTLSKIKMGTYNIKYNGRKK